MKQAYKRSQVLRSRLNDFLCSLTGISRDYYGELSGSQLIQLKSALSDINNIFTLKLTEKSLTWISRVFKLSQIDKKKLSQQIDSVKPNTNGFDIEITLPQVKVVAEIKAIVPINEGQYYGAAQRNAILDDAIKLLKGKKSIPDTHNYYKFLFLIDLGDRTDQAIEKIMTPAKNINTTDEKRLQRHDVVHKLKDGSEIKTPADVSTRFVYIRKIAL